MLQLRVNQATKVDYASSDTLQQDLRRMLTGES